MLVHVSGAIHLAQNWVSSTNVANRKPDITAPVQREFPSGANFKGHRSCYTQSRLALDLHPPASNRLEAISNRSYAHIGRHWSFGVLALKTADGLLGAGCQEYEVGVHFSVLYTLI